MQWCSFCTDRDADILLCAGCRVGMCVQNVDERHSGCLEPHPAQRREDFVFFCPYCCRRTRQKFPVSAEFPPRDLQVNFQQFAFTTNNAPPSKHSLFYRYDPPVLIVNLTLGNDAGDAIGSILPEMKKWYRGNDKAVSYHASTWHSHFF